MEKLALSISGVPIHAPGGIPTEGTNTISSVLGVAFGILIVVAIIAALIYIVWGAIDWITSEGDKQKVNQARTKIGFAILGLFIIFLAFLIVNIIQQFFGLNPSSIPFSNGGVGHH